MRPMVPLVLVRQDSALVASDLTEFGETLLSSYTVFQVEFVALAAAEGPKITDWISAIATVGGFAVAAIAAYGAVGTLRAQSRAISEEREARRQDVDRLQAQAIVAAQAAARTVILSTSSRIRPMMAMNDRADWITARATLVNFGETPILRVTAQVELKRPIARIRLHTPQGLKNLTVDDRLGLPCVLHDLKFPVVASGAEVEWEWPGIEVQFPAIWPLFQGHGPRAAETLWFTDSLGDVNQTPDAVVTIQFTDIHGLQWKLSSTEPGGSLSRVMYPDQSTERTAR